jgi:hypothetical protein
MGVGEAAAVGAALGVGPAGGADGAAQPMASEVASRGNKVREAFII